MNRKILFIDMDGVLVDLEKEIHNWFEFKPLLEKNLHLKEMLKKNPDHIHGIFRNPLPIEGAVEAVKKLYECGKYELFIATAAPWGNPEAATDKRYWIEKYFGDIFYKRMFITHRKDLLKGDYLIDDRTANGASEFQGELIQFGNDKFPNWDSVLNYLLN